MQLSRTTESVQEPSQQFFFDDRSAISEDIWINKHILETFTPYRKQKKMFKKIFF